jgi:hypothetical protein
MKMRGSLASIAASATAATACLVLVGLGGAPTLAGAAIPGTCFLGLGGITACDTGSAAVGVLDESGGEVIGINCAATAEGLVAATGVVTCNLENASGVVVSTLNPTWAPGSSSDIQKVTSPLPVASYKLCVQVAYLTFQGQLVTGNLNCYPV